MNLIKRLHDQHLHSEYSFDSKEKLENYYKYVNQIGCSYIVTTEHIEFESVYNNQDWTVDFESLSNDLNILHQKYPNLTPLLGVELGYRKDHLEKMKNLLASQNFDLVNMSIHDNGKYDYYMKKDYQEIGIKNMLNIYFNNAIDGVKTFKDYDVLSHIDYGFKTAYMLDNSLRIEDYENYLKEIFTTIIKDNKALEINFKVQQTINDDNHLKALLNMYKKYGGVKLTLSSDAHFLDQIDSYYNNQQRIMCIIKECGFNQLSYFVKRKEYIYEI